LLAGPWSPIHFKNALLLGSYLPHFACLDDEFTSQHLQHDHESDPLAFGLMAKNYLKHPNSFK
jgi:hypothetical protein